MPGLQRDLERQALTVDQLVIDRGYINSTLVDDVLRRRGKIVCKPWKSHNGQLFPKSAFTLNLRDRTIACPNGQVQPFTFGTIVEFDPDVCDHCALRSHCTTAEPGQGRSVAIAENEQLQHRLRTQIQTSAGRAALRERTIIEHKLAHISQRQGTARAMWASARTRSISVVRAPSRTWKRCIGQRSDRERLRNDIIFKPFGVLGGARVDACHFRDGSSPARVA